jgi:hypothetical protein
LLNQPFSPDQQPDNVRSGGDSADVAALSLSHEVIQLGHVVIGKLDFELLHGWGSKILDV